MAGTKAGGLKAAAKNLAKDPDFYARIGSKGGANSRTGGFASMTPCYCAVVSLPHHKAQCAGVKGGSNRYGYRKSNTTREDKDEQATGTVSPHYAKGTA